MRALVIHKAKDLRIEERSVESPKAGEVQVQIATGGICGSDLHYYQHGGFGPITLKGPMVLGHEVSGHIVSVGDGVTGLQPGDLVAVSPSRPCGHCKYCAEGLRNHCLNMRFYGSAMPWPHIDGAFQQVINADASQCVPASGISSGEAAMAEPFAVTLHATGHAGSMLGKRVLVTGCGPIGVLSIIAARRAGAVEIVATDLEDNALAFARQAGADRVINVMQEGQALDAYAGDKGYFDVLYECSGAAPALSAGIAALRPRAHVLQLGLGGDMTVPMMQLTAKELQLCGSFRFHEEFTTAVQLMQNGLVDLKPYITHTVSLDEAESGFELAADRSQAMKAQIAFA